MFVILAILSVQKQTPPETTITRGMTETGTSHRRSVERGGFGLEECGGAGLEDTGASGRYNTNRDN